MANEVSYNLELLVQNLEPKYIKPRMENACALVKNDASQMAPVDTGELSRSIDFEVAGDGTEGVIYSNLEYAVYVELGTGIYASRGGGRQTPWRYQDGEGEWHTTRGQRPQPYLEPALQQNTNQIIAQFEGMF